MTRGRPVKRRKRRNKEGSIYVAKRNGIKYWAFQITMPDGKQSKPKYSRSLEAAQEALLKARAQIASGVLPSDMTFEDWSEHWLATKAYLKQGTQWQYKHNLAFASKFFGNKLLSKIQAHDLETMLKAVRKAGKSSTTARQVFINVSACLRAAYRRGLMVRDISWNRSTLRRL
jgi:hypothetical protein